MASLKRTWGHHRFLRDRYPASLEHRECSGSLNRFGPSKPPEFFWRTPFMRRDGNRSAEKLKSEIAGAERIRRRRSEVRRQKFWISAHLKKSKVFLKCAVMEA